MSRRLFLALSLVLALAYITFLGLTNLDFLPASGYRIHTCKVSEAALLLGRDVQAKQEKEQPSESLARDDSAGSLPVSELTVTPEADAQSGEGRFR